MHARATSDLPVHARAYAIHMHHVHTYGGDYHDKHDDRHTWSNQNFMIRGANNNYEQNKKLRGVNVLKYRYAHGAYSVALRSCRVRRLL